MYLQKSGQNRGNLLNNLPDDRENRVLKEENEIHDQKVTNKNRYVEKKGQESETHRQKDDQKNCHEFEILLIELEGLEREHKLLIDQLKVDIKIKEAIIESLEADNVKQKDTIDDLEEDVKALESELKKAEGLEEMEEMIAVVKQKNEKIEELEEALRQSVAIATDMETDKQQEEDRMKEITNKLAELERKLHSARLQRAGQGSSSSAPCGYCPQLRLKLQQTSEDLKSMVAERRRHLEELFDMKHEALMSAMSEKDAHLALLEESGVQGSRAQQEYKLLTQARAALLRTIHKQSEGRVLLLQEYEGGSSMQTEGSGTVPHIQISCAGSFSSSDEEEEEEVETDEVESNKKIQSDRSDSREEEQRQDLQSRAATATTVSTVNTTAATPVTTPVITTTRVTAASTTTEVTTMIPAVAPATGTDVVGACSGTASEAPSIAAVADSTGVPATTNIRGISATTSNTSIASEMATNRAATNVCIAAVTATNILDTATARTTEGTVTTDTTAGCSRTSVAGPVPLTEL